jgi:hypothetical protein
MTPKKEYQEKYSTIKPVQEWINLSNDPTVDYFVL